MHVMLDRGILCHQDVQEDGCAIALFKSPFAFAEPSSS